MTSSEPPRAYYRCAVQSWLPIVLENVRTQQGPLLIAGNESTIGLSALGVAAMTIFGRIRRNVHDGQVRMTEATGEAVVLDDRIVLDLVAQVRVRGVTITNNAADRTVHREIAYGLIKRWGHTPDGIYLDIWGHDAVWLRSPNDNELAAWLTRLTDGKLWRDPEPRPLRALTAVERWCQQDPRFTFAIPAGWGDPNPTAREQNARGIAPYALRAAIGTADGYSEAHFNVIEVPAVGVPGGLPADALSAAAQFVASDAIAVVGPLERIALDGEPAIMLRGTSTSRMGFADRSYVYLIRNGIHFVAWYQVVDPGPDTPHERWLPEFETILASWHWYA